MGAVSALRPKLSLALPALLTALVLAACGSSGGSSSSSSAASEPPRRVPPAAARAPPRRAPATRRARAQHRRARARAASSTTPRGRRGRARRVPDLEPATVVRLRAGRGRHGVHDLCADQRRPAATCTLFGYPGVSILNGAGPDRAAPRPARGDPGADARQAGHPEPGWPGPLPRHQQRRDPQPRLPARLHRHHAPGLSSQPAPGTHAFPAAVSSATSTWDRSRPRS